MTDHISELVKKYTDIAGIENDIRKAYEIIHDGFASGNTLLIAGNGGSAADAAHITGELMKSMCVDRPIDDETKKKLVEVDAEIGEILSNSLEAAFPTIDLTASPIFTTAFSNDREAVDAFAQLVLGYGKKGDTLLAITTSGNSENLIRAAVAAHARGMKVVVLTGRDGGKIKKYADVCVVVPLNTTADIQERHLPIYHAWCRQLEDS